MKMKKFDQTNSKDFLTLQKHITGLEASNRELVQVKDALYESEELHRITLGSISDAVFITKNSGEFTYVCPNASVIFGYSPEEVHDLGYIQKLLGKDIFDPADIKASGEIQNIEKEITDKNETSHTVLINIKSVSIKGGTILFTCRDFTVRRLKKRRLEHLNSVLIAINKINRHIARGISKKKLLQLTCDSLIESGGYISAWAGLLGISGNFNFVAEAGWGKYFLKMDKDLKQGTLPKCAQTPFNGTDMKATCDPSVSCEDCALAALYNGRSALSIRLEHKGVVYGHLSVSVPGEFFDSKEVHSLFLEVAKNISFALRGIELNREQKLAHRKIQVYQHQLRSMASELRLTEERERRRIATELHDLIGQNLAFSKIKLGSLQDSLQAGAVRRTIKEIRDLIEQAIDGTRSLTFELSPPILYELGLEAALEWLAENIYKRNGLPVTIRNSGKLEHVDDHIGFVIFQVVRELLINVVKHAQADRAFLTIASNGREIKINVEDKGKGFDTEKIRLHSTTIHGFGLFSARERIEYIGGKFTIESGRGDGTKAAITLPLDGTSTKAIDNQGPGILLRDNH